MSSARGAKTEHRSAPPRTARGNDFGRLSLGLSWRSKESYSPPGESRLGGGRPAIQRDKPDVRAKCFERLSTNGVLRRALRYLSANGSSRRNLRTPDRLPRRVPSRSPACRSTSGSTASPGAPEAGHQRADAIARLGEAGEGDGRQAWSRGTPRAASIWRMRGTTAWPSSSPSAMSQTTACGHRRCRDPPSTRARRGADEGLQLHLVARQQATAAPPARPHGRQWRYVQAGERTGWYTERRGVRCAGGAARGAVSTASSGTPSRSACRVRRRRLDEKGPALAFDGRAHLARIRAAWLRQVAVQRVQCWSGALAMSPRVLHMPPSATVRRAGRRRAPGSARCARAAACTAAPTG